MRNTAKLPITAIEKRRFGANLKTIRRALGLSQSALADLSGTPQRRIAGFETGKSTNPTLETMQKLAGALGVKVTDLLEGVRGC